MTFDSFVARDVFSELNGFVLCDPNGLDRHHGGTARGLDLLTLYSTTEQGDTVAAAGAAIPVMGVETGEYTLVVRHAEAASPLVGPPRIVSSGWILRAEAEPLCLCGAGYLVKWDPDNQKVLRSAVPSGWYEVEIQGGFGNADRSEWVIEFVLRPAAQQPAFSADLSTEFNFIDEGSGA